MTGVDVQFLGCGDAFGSGGRLQTCFYVESESAHFLIDCGASSLTAIKRQGLSTNSVETILLTHLHGDHFGGVPFFIIEAQLVSKRTTPLTIAGPPGTEARICEAQEALFPASTHNRPAFPITYVEWIDQKPTHIGGLVVTPFQVVHGSGAPPFALRVECAGKVIAYSGDTEWTDALIPAAQGADLFICECYTFDKPAKFHLNYRMLMAQRPALGCKRLVLTHMGADMLGRLERVELEYAEEGRRISV